MGKSSQHTYKSTAHEILGERKAIHKIFEMSLFKKMVKNISIHIYEANKPCRKLPADTLLSNVLNLKAKINLEK